MKILCISRFDNGGQMQAVSDALNKYTTHECHHLNFISSFLKYDVEISYNDHSFDEISTLINNSDFFIFSEFIPNELIQFKILDKIKWNNVIIRTYGSISRSSLKLLRTFWYNHFVVFSSGGIDPTIHPYIGFVAYHIPSIYEFNNFPVINTKQKLIKICHAHTTKSSKEIKKTDEIIEILNTLKLKYDIEPIIITHKSWEESLKIKAQCDITIDQFKLGAYGGSAIESMYLKHVVVSNINPLVKSVHPDLPIVQATLDNLFYVLEDLIVNKNKRAEIGTKSKEYAIREHSAKLNIVKWNYLIEWVSNL